MEAKQSIPKIIHYCWFGRASLPPSAIKCIESWKVYFPDYEIKRWDEDNFNINCCKYVEEAYKEKKWAFVSDYARFWILYNYGGIYFDTDVEVIRNMDDIIDHGAFMGCEKNIKVYTSKKARNDYGVENRLNINTGLGIAAYKRMDIYKRIMDSYEDAELIDNQGVMLTVVQRITTMLLECGYDPDKLMRHECQVVEGITIYPEDFFCPKNYYTGVIELTDNTRTIHHYTATWHTASEKYIYKIERYFNKKGKQESQIKGVLELPFRFKNKINKMGLVNTLKFIFLKKLCKKG